jgi:hypothetical protein
MIGAIAILLIAVWFHQTAQKFNLPSLQWVIGGVIVYYAGFSIWMYLVLRPLLGGLFQNHGLWLGLGMDISSVLMGALLAAIFRAKVMMKKGQKPFETPL